MAPDLPAGGGLDVARAFAGNSRFAGNPLVHKALGHPERSRQGLLGVAGKGEEFLELHGRDNSHAFEKVKSCAFDRAATRQ